MKLFALLCSALALSANAHAFQEATPPKRDLWEKLLTSRIVVADRKRVIELAVLLPKIYGFRFVCQFQSATQGAPPVAVLPGEWLEAADGGSLHCPDEYDLTLDKQTRLRIMQAGLVPRFVVAEGKATLRTKQEAFYFETPAFEISGIGEGKEQLLTVVSKPDMQSLSCDRGAVSMRLELRETPGQQLLSSRDCRLGLTLDGTATKRYLVGSDEVDAANIAVPRRFWPTKPPPARPTGVDLLNGLQLSYVPSANRAEPAKVSWIVQRLEPPVLPELSCTVFGQKTEGDAQVEIQKFVSSNLSGSFTVDPAYQHGLVSMLCESETVTLSSNIQDLAALSQVGERLPAK